MTCRRSGGPAPRTLTHWRLALSEVSWTAVCAAPGGGLQARSAVARCSGTGHQSSWLYAPESAASGFVDVGVCGPGAAWNAAPTSRARAMVARGGCPRNRVLVRAEERAIGNQVSRALPARAGRLCVLSKHAGARVVEFRNHRDTAGVGQHPADFLARG